MRDSSRAKASFESVTFALKGTEKRRPNKRQIPLLNVSSVPKPPLDIGGNIVVAKFDCIGEKEGANGRRGISLGFVRCYEKLEM